MLNTMAQINRSSLFFFEKISIATRFFRIKKLLFKKNKKILDIGFGRGIELSILQKKKSNLWG